MFKACFKCKRVLPLGDFYGHPAMKDGHLGKCKECTKSDVSANYMARVEAKRDYEKHRAQSERRKKWCIERQKRLRMASPEKYKARSAVANAVRDGRLTRLACQVCGNPHSQAHHSDYSQPLEVTWLCFTCHRQEHGQLNYIQKAG